MDFCLFFFQKFKAEFKKVIIIIDNCLMKKTKKLSSQSNNDTINGQMFGQFLIKTNYYKITTINVNIKIKFDIYLINQF